MRDVGYQNVIIFYYLKSCPVIKSIEDKPGLSKIPDQLDRLISEWVNKEYLNAIILCYLKEKTMGM